MMNRVSYNNKDNIRLQSYSNNIPDKYSHYLLEITPFWKSSLKGSPSAIKVQAEHIQLDSSGVYLYSQIWARYGNKGESLFTSNGSISTINMYQNDLLDTDSLYINEPIKSDDIIKIKISRNYGGIIKFHLTPIMSYGELTHLTKTIILDQNKIANGEVELTQWSYNIHKSVGTIIKDDTSTEYSTEEIKTTIKKNSTDAADIEIKTVDSTIRKRYEEPVISTTYIYHLNITYGFDSYMYDNQVPDNSDINRHLKFYDIEDINIQNINGNKSECINLILNLYTPVHTEVIPTGVIHGGSTTVNYILNSSECKLKPNKTYLCICYVVTKTEDAEFIYTDYRYLHTNEIFNEHFGIVRDFNELNLPIIPTINLQFDSNRIEEQYIEYIDDDKTIETNTSELSKSIQWIGDTDGAIDTKFSYICKINSNPVGVNFEYNDGLFSLNYSSNSTKNKIDPVFEYNDMSGEGVDVIVVDNCESSVVGENHSFKIDYRFNCQRDTKPGILKIGSVLTNILNSKLSVDKHGLFLSEAKDNENTMMFEDDAIFTVGMHNDGGGNQEWYGEVGTTSEGYSTSSLPYDDSIDTNSPLEIDLSFYNEEVSINDSKLLQHYYLKHGKELILYPSEKDDCSETLNTYLLTDNPHKFLQESLDTRSIVPIFFITSGFSNDNADKALSCCIVDAYNIRGGSSPGHGYSKSEDEDIEKNNFNKEYPYWYLNWKGVNPYGGMSILGTFLLKHVDRKGGYTYIPTNNYFCMSVDPNNYKTFANYIEDRNDLYVLVNSETKYSNTNPYKLLNLGRNYYFAYRHNTKIRYSVGDLLATLLALFGIIESYSTPLEIETDQYTISQESKDKLNRTASSSITYKANYTIEIDENLANMINLSLLSGLASLYNFYLKLPSNNLVSAKIDTNFIYTEKFTFNPILELVPDFSNDSYLARITPYGEISYNILPKTDGSNDLYYWNDDKDCYEVYKQNTDYPLYKYCKFYKFIYTDSEDLNRYLVENGLNPKNYQKTSESLLDNFITLSITDTNRLIIRMPLKHSRYLGLHTLTKTKLNGKLTFTCVKNGAVADSQRDITNLATIPRIYKNGDFKFWVVDSTLRI